MQSCLICDAAVEPVLTFGRMPIANGFLTPDRFAEEYFYDLAVGLCRHCTMVQLLERVPREKLFHGNYPFYSSTSEGMARHFKGLAESVMATYLRGPDAFVVEIGSNDGILLQHIARTGIAHLGVEPSSNVAQVAMEQGIQTVCQFFGETTAREILAAHGQADVVLGANVLCHISDLRSVIAGVKSLLKPDGVLIFEDPYLGDIVEETSFDQIYDEHVWYFSVTSVSHLMQLHGLEVIDVQPQRVHGGSMRYVIGRRGRHVVSPAVTARRTKEQALALHAPETFAKLRRRIEGSRDQLRSLLHRLQAQAKRVVGYGATSKSTTVINYCGITPQLLEFISDTTPMKQGKLSPGAHIPVRSHAAFVAHYPDYALLFAWNHVEEIMAKEQPFRRAGGKWIVYVPVVRVLE